MILAVALGFNIWTLFAVLKKIKLKISEFVQDMTQIQRFLCKEVVTVWFSLHFELQIRYVFTKLIRVEEYLNREIEGLFCKRKLFSFHIKFTLSNMTVFFHFTSKFRHIFISFRRNISRKPSWRSSIHTRGKIKYETSQPHVQVHRTRGSRSSLRRETLIPYFIFKFTPWKV